MCNYSGLYYTLPPVEGIKWQLKPGALLLIFTLWEADLNPVVLVSKSGLGTSISLGTLPSLKIVHIVITVQ